MTITSRINPLTGRETFTNSAAAGATTGLANPPSVGGATGAATGSTAATGATGGSGATLTTGTSGTTGTTAAAGMAPAPPPPTPNGILPAVRVNYTSTADAARSTAVRAAPAWQVANVRAAPASQAGISNASLMTNPDGTPFDFNRAAGPMQGAITYEPGQNSLVSAQLEKLLAKDSQYMQLARTRASQTSAGRGLLNSSIAAGAGEAAAIEAGRPIAEGDASAYFTAQRDNASAQNTFARDANAFSREGALTTFREGNTTNRFNAEQTNSTNRFNAGETNTTNRFNADQTNTNRRFNAGEINTTNRFNTDQTNTNNRFNTDQTNTNRRFNADQSNATRRFNTTEENNMRSQTNAASIELQRMGYANDLNRANVPANFALATSTTLMNGVNTIMADPNLTPEAKRGAVQNLVTYANSQMTWASGFFGTPMEPFTTPATAPTPPPPR